MLLVVNGCSYTYGYEIDESVREKSCYGNVLADKIWYDSFNIAVSGSSNDRIFRTTLDWIFKNDYEKVFFVIGWTNKNRREYYYAPYKNYIQLVNRGYTQDFDNKIRQQMYEWYYEDCILSDDASDDINYLHNVINLQNVFKSRNINYLMFDCVKNHSWQKSNECFYNEIDYERYVTETTFLDYVEERGYPFEPYGPQKNLRGHPLEEAHKAWGHYLFDYVKEHDIIQNI